MKMPTLYSYFRSTAAYRVRIALAIKEIDYQLTPVHLLRNGGEQHSQEYRKLNPAGLVPSLDTGSHVLTQSLAIIEYLDETHPQPALLPEDPMQRAAVRALAFDIASDIHPINNLRVLNRLKEDYEIDANGVNRWIQHWIHTGFSAIEATLRRSNSNGNFCFGEHATMADLCLIPQMFNARRFDCNMEEFPTIVSIDAHCNSLPAFSDTAPQHQVDAE